MVIIYAFMPKIQEVTICPENNNYLKNNNIFSRKLFAELVS